MFFFFFLEDTLAHGDKNRESCCILYMGARAQGGGGPGKALSLPAPLPSHLSPPKAGCYAKGEQVVEAPPPAQGQGAAEEKSWQPERIVLPWDWLRTDTCRTAKCRPGISAGGAWGGQGQGDATRSRAPGEGGDGFGAGIPAGSCAETVRIKGHL